jgi:hypothetical protein
MSAPKGDAFARAQQSRGTCFSDRAIQTFGDSASGHRAPFDRAIQTFGDSASGHRALALAGL